MMLPGILPRKADTVTKHQRPTGFTPCWPFVVCAVLHGSHRHHNAPGIHPAMVAQWFYENR